MCRQILGKPLLSLNTTTWTTSGSAYTLPAVKLVPWLDYILKIKLGGVGGPSTSTVPTSHTKAPVGGGDWEADGNRG